MLVRERLFRNGPMPRTETVIEDVDVSTLDQGHILPNMSPPNVRGIWFPWDSASDDRFGAGGASNRTKAREYLRQGHTIASREPKTEIWSCASPL